jgi:hypothetical protein
MFSSVDLNGLMGGIPNREDRHPGLFAKKNPQIP